MANTKYSLDNNDSIQGTGVKLFRMTAKRDIKTCVGTVKKGSHGGYVASYISVGDKDESWCFPTGTVDATGRVRGEAVVMSGNLDSLMKENTVLDSLNLLKVERGGTLDTMKAVEKPKKTAGRPKKKLGLKKASK